MQNWCKWCIRHNLSFILYIYSIPFVFGFLFIHSKEAIKEWAEEFVCIGKQIKRYKESLKDKTK